MICVDGIVLEALAALRHPRESHHGIGLVLVAYVERHIDDQLAAVVAGTAALLTRLHGQAGVVAVVMGHQVCPAWVGIVFN